MAQKYREGLSSIQLVPATTRMISTVYGAEVREEMAKAEYWVEHMAGTVRYKQALEASWELNSRSVKSKVRLRTVATEPVGEKLHSAIISRKTIVSLSGGDEFRSVG